MKVITFKAEHLEAMALQDAQSYLTAWVSPAMAKTLEDHNSYTGVEGGKVICCGGVIPLWVGRSMMWSYLSKDAGKHIISIHNETRRFLDDCYVQRMEATVDVGFAQGHRWMRMLGFKMEASCMKAYRPDGGDCSLYARVRP